MENNIHILPTDKPSRLFIDIDNDKLTITNNPIGGEHMMNQNIYIISDEEIKEGDWCLGKENYPTKNWNAIEGFEEHYKKVILTTDQELIKDRVQSIDDEFLEWFVKNPSCENIEVIKTFEDYTIVGGKSDEIYYKIIISKEEPKQRLEKYSERFDNDKSAIGNPETWGKRMVDKQETLSQAALKYSEEPNYFGRKSGFRAGAEWQQEQNKKLYSLDNLKEAFAMGRTNATIKDFNTKFKNK